MSMTLLSSPASMLHSANAVARGDHTKQPRDLLRSLLWQLTPPDSISTVECAERYRKLRGAEGSTTTLWRRDVTPYNVGPMDALDRRDVREVIMPKPARSGGTVVAENYLFKSMRFGPPVDCLWYLKSGDEAKTYCRNQIQPMFDDHPEVMAKLGRDIGDSTITRKVVSGRAMEWLGISPATVTNRQAAFIVLDEIDSYVPAFASSAKSTARARGRALGSRRKAFMASHPDKGWSSGIASEWIDTTRGIYVMECPECEQWASPYPTKYWPDVVRFTLHYDRNDEWDRDQRLAATEHASMLCPHCGSFLSEPQRRAMVDAGQWMHRGQTLSDVGPVGEVEPNESWGFWVHGLMVKMTTLRELARELEQAIIKFETTGNAKDLRAVAAKILGEVPGERDSKSATDVVSLRRRVEQSEIPKATVPAWARFITASIDVGGAKFDIGFWAWDEDGRSCLLERRTIRQVPDDDGQLRDIAPRERLDDWFVLIDQVIKRRFPIADQEWLTLPVAVTALDGGDGNVTHKARAFARECMKRSLFWGDASNPWSRLKLIKGSKRETAPPLPTTPRKVSKDERGKEVSPVVFEYDLGVHKLKEIAVERLGIADDRPGQCSFVQSIAGRYLEEFFGETLIDGKWVRTGPNESLDLFGYADAVRMMLGADRVTWTAKRLPPWATPLTVETEEGGDLAVAANETAKKPSLFSAFD